ncbi:MAG: siderophore ABC transporter substrate-binding protein [Suipraeoptans sp.]
MKLKKFLAVILSATMMLSLAACGTSSTASDSENTESENVDSEAATETSEDPESVMIVSLNGEGEAVEIEVPYNPEKVAVMDLATLDILDNIDMGDRVSGVSKGSSIDYLQKYVDDDNIVNLGTIKEADMEAVMECEPEVIFIGGRLSASYDALSEIAPVIYLGTDTELGVVESTEINALKIASIFGEEEKIEDLMSDYNSRIEELQAFAEGKTAMVGIVTSGGFNLLGNDGRCSIIGVEIGFDNLGLEAAASSSRGGGGRSSEGEKSEGSSESSDSTENPHGEESSFELLVSINPEYIFVMDRDAAIGTEGAQLAKEVMENELVMQTDAYQNDNIVYLANPAVWYTAEGGISALDVMISDLEEALLD